MSGPSRVVLVGGGYVTLHAYRVLARRLGSRLRDGSLEIVVVSADDCHSFHGFTPEVIAGDLPLSVTRTPLREACRRARFVHAAVRHVDTERRVLTLEPHVPAGEETGAATYLRYDELVVGVGSREPVATVPGLDEHGHTLRGLGQIASLAERIDALAAAARGSSVEAAEAVVVIGGGLGGTEIAAAVAARGAGRLPVVLVHSGEALTPELGATHPRLSARVETELARCGVEVVLGERVASCTASEVVLAGGRRIAASTVIGTVGAVAVRLPGLEHLPVDVRGRLITGPDLSVAPGIWAAGDAALVRHPGSGAPVPGNALWAIKGGAVLGANVARSLRGRATRRFGYRGLGMAATFGRGRGVGEIYGVPLTGWVSWIMRLAFFLRFMPLRRNAVATVRHTVSGWSAPLRTSAGATAGSPGASQRRRAA